MNRRLMLAVTLLACAAPAVARSDPAVCVEGEKFGNLVICIGPNTGHDWTIHDAAELQSQFSLARTGGQVPFKVLRGWKVPELVAGFRGGNTPFSNSHDERDAIDHE